MLCWYMEERFEPILDELAEYECQAAVVAALHAAADTTQQGQPALYQNLYALEQADGAALSVRADTAAMERLRLALLTAMQAAIDGLPERTVMVPFGTLTGFSLLNRLGPGWPLTMQPAGCVEGHIEEEAAAVAINQTRYSAVLCVQVTVDLILDGKNRVLYVSESIPLASVVVGGQVPVYYGGA